MSELATAISEVDDALGAYRFNDAAAAIYRFTWNTVCDWYLEIAKPVFLGEDEAAKTETRRVTVSCSTGSMPCCIRSCPSSREVWAARRASGHAMGCSATASGQFSCFHDENAASDLNWLVGLVGEIRSIRSE